MNLPLRRRPLLGGSLRRGLLFLALLAAPGCGDSSDTLLRGAANLKSEITDRVMKVHDEESARKFFEHYLRIYFDRVKDLDDRWQKWIKDIEEDYRKERIRIVHFKTIGAPGDDQWLKDAALNVPAKGDPRVTKTREDFAVYMRKINADKERLNREKERIAVLIKLRVADKINEEISKGIEQPIVDPKVICPSLVKMTDPGTYKNMLLTGSEKPGS